MAMRAIRIEGSLTMMGVIGTKSMTVRRVGIGSERGIGMRGIDMGVTRGGARSTLSMLTLTGEGGRGRGANQGMIVTMIIQGGGTNVLRTSKHLLAKW